MNLPFYFLLPLLFFAQVSYSQAPDRIPSELYNDYTLQQTIPVIYAYRDDSLLDNLVYSQEQIDAYVEMVQAKQMHYYGVTDQYLYQALDKHLNLIKGKNVAVLGSMDPWYESVLLAYGATPTTVDRKNISCTDARVKVMSLSEFEKNPKTFDAVLSISRIEHEGLGRYGDPLDPNADLVAMDIAKKMLKEEGLLFLSVPVGKDYLIWNFHRVYGKLRLKALLKGWRIVGYYGFTSENLETIEWSQTHQPVFVLKPIR